MDHGKVDGLHNLGFREDENPEDRHIPTGHHLGDSGKDGYVSRMQRTAEKRRDDKKSISSKGLCCGLFSKMPWFVFFCCVLNFLEGYVVNGITNINIPAFELQYQLPSTRSALIASATNIGALICVLFVSYIGARHHKPIWTAIGALVMCVGSVVFMVPHWHGDLYQHPAKSSPDVFCADRINASIITAPPVDESPYLGIFMLGNALHGAGYTPLYTLAIAYMDENERHDRTGLYVGLFYASAAVGVAVGFLTGGQFQQYYVDFDRVNMSSIDITPMDYGYWVGAWWLGYIVSVAGFFLFALPLFCYPKHMPRLWENKEESNDGGDHVKPDDAGGIVKLLPDFFRAFVKLFLNPIFLLLTLAATCIGMIINGISAFSAKYLLEQYGLPIDVVGYILSALIIVGSGGGMVLGGVFVNVFKLEIRGMVRLCVICALIGSFCGFSLLANCPELPLAGVNKPYSNHSFCGTPHKARCWGSQNACSLCFHICSMIGDINSTCNTACHCETIQFSPVCGDDGTVYYSPCHAGCPLGMSPMEYSNCSCVLQSQMSNGEIPSGKATFGRCDSDCDMIYVLVPFMFLMFLTIFIITTPVSMATLRCVEDDLRPFALGVQWTVMRLLGFIPGPVLVGFVIDQSCLLWSGKGSQGACLLYHRENIALNLFLWWIIVTAIAFVLFVIAAIYSGKRKSKKCTVTKI